MPCAKATWGATVRGTYGTAGLVHVRRTYSARRLGPSCPAPPVRTARRRLIRVARTYSTEALGRTCKLRKATAMANVKPNQSRCWSSFEECSARASMLPTWPKPAAWCAAGSYGKAAMRLKGFAPRRISRRTMSGESCTMHATCSSGVPLRSAN
eukprot:scaffold31184_cov69-Phaeocystis_antarctica.AAC.2